VLTVEFTVLGIPCLGLNGGPAFKHTEAFSFQIATENQEETDRYWNAIVGNGGMESQCGWCKDRWGISWQITPRALTEALSAGGGEAKRAFEAMMTMKKIDVAARLILNDEAHVDDHRGRRRGGQLEVVQDAVRSAGYSSRA
jgi:predicted 3-demethylubiquinone-9 3-methyltransferase (glyoxalase superfamily)